MILTDIQAKQLRNAFVQLGDAVADLDDMGITHMYECFCEKCGIDEDNEISVPRMAFELGGMKHCIETLPEMPMNIRDFRYAILNFMEFLAAIS